ncbi:MAG: hypothetical protein ACRERR_14095 [Moraxellaceae bacterium]
MSKNTKQTSKGLASKAAGVLQDKSASQIAKSLAASALSQREGSKQTSAEMESKASQVLNSPKYSDQTKSLAASVLSQANKER